MFLSGNVNRTLVVGLCAALFFAVGGCGRGKQGRMPESEMASLQKWFQESLEELGARRECQEGSDAESLYWFTIHFCSIAHKYAISQDDVVKMLGNPIWRDQTTYEFEHQCPGCRHGTSILVWFDKSLNATYCFPAERPMEYVVPPDVKERLKNCYRELLLPLKGRGVVGTTEIDSRLKKMKTEFKEVLKAKTFTYRDVVDIMGTPTGPEMPSSMNVDLSMVPYGKSTLARGMLVVGYRFRLNESASAVLCFVFCESIGGCLGTVETSWVEAAN